MTKKNEKLSQIEPIKVQTNENFIKGSIVEYLKKRWIPSKNTTLEKIGQTTLVFTNKVESKPKEDDSIYAAVRYLKYKRQNP